MRFLNHLFKPKVLRQLEHALRAGRYPQAWAICQTNPIEQSIKAEVQYKLKLFEAIAASALDDPFQKTLRQVAGCLQVQAIVEAMPDAERTITQLARVANLLKLGSTEQAMQLAMVIPNKEGCSQAIRKVAGHMASEGLPLDEMLRIIKTIPMPAYANEEMRNLSISKIIQKEFDAARQILPHIALNGYDVADTISYG